MTTMTTVTTGVRSAGEFCWINMLTPEPKAACDFFAAVLGWTYGEIPGMGYTVKAGGQEMGGLFDFAGPGTPPGVQPYIGVMVKVDNADAACARVRELGGTAQPAFDIGGRLRMAVCKDPSGVEFDLWESKASAGMEVDRRVPGAPSWFEALTKNPGRATPFYRDLFGWTSKSEPIPEQPGESYTTFEREGRPVAGLLELTPRMTGPGPQWAVYFTVADADAAVASALQHGGIQGFPVREVPGVGRFCALASPQGVMFYVLELAA
jgi:predicted enzyme related to lactoylglutathione lyase